MKEQEILTPAEKLVASLVKSGDVRAHWVIAKADAQGGIASITPPFDTYDDLVDYLLSSRRTKSMYINNRDGLISINLKPDEQVKELSKGEIYTNMANEPLIHGKPKNYEFRSHHGDGLGKEGKLDLQYFKPR